MDLISTGDVFISVSLFVSPSSRDEDPRDAENPDSCQQRVAHYCLRLESVPDHHSTSVNFFFFYFGR